LIEEENTSPTHVSRQFPADVSTGAQLGSESYANVAISNIQNQLLKWEEEYHAQPTPQLHNMSKANSSIPENWLDALLKFNKSSQGRSVELSSDNWIATILNQPSNIPTRIPKVQN